MAQYTVSADLSMSPGLPEWFEKYKVESHLSLSDIIRNALDYYRASTGPEVVLLKAELEKLKGRVTLLDNRES
jgi:hypothetical protein